MVSLLVMDHRHYMRRALVLAAKALGMTSPNPMVGAVLVRNGRIIGEGFHKKAGTPHAEVNAIADADGDVSGATLYVSLEPCCHKDKRTPPCTEAIVSSGITRVVVAMRDPNPKVSGRGIAELERANIEVVSGVLEEEAHRQNESYVKFITTGRPFVILKVAMTLDGKIATPEGESKWITGDRARRLVHRLRGSADAVMTAIGTVKADNPRLTCRIGRGKNPIRIVIDPRLEVDPYSNVAFCPPETIVVTRGEKEDAAISQKKMVLREKGVRLIEHEGERPDLPSLMKELGKANITLLLIEGGASLNAACLEAGIVDKVMFFIAPKLIGGRASFPAVGGSTFRRLTEAHRLVDTRIRRIGEDFLIEGYLRS